MLALSLARQPRLCVVTGVAGGPNRREGRAFRCRLFSVSMTLFNGLIRCAPMGHWRVLVLSGCLFKSEIGKIGRQACKHVGETVQVLGRRRRRRRYYQLWVLLYMGNGGGGGGHYFPPLHHGVNGGRADGRAD